MISKTYNMWSKVLLAAVNIPLQCENVYSEITNAEVQKA